MNCHYMHTCMYMYILNYTLIRLYNVICMQVFIGDHLTLYSNCVLFPGEHCPSHSPVSSIALSSLCICQIAQYEVDVWIASTVRFQLGIMMLTLCGAGNGNQGLVHNTKALYELSYIRSLSYIVNLHFILM